MSIAVQVGHQVPNYKNSDFSRIPQDVKMEDVWQLVGPQVDKHIRALPIWQVFCVVYLEGLMHGAEAQKVK